MAWAHNLLQRVHTPPALIVSFANSRVRILGNGRAAVAKSQILVVITRKTVLGGRARKGVPGKLGHHLKKLRAGSPSENSLPHFEEDFRWISHHFAVELRNMGPSAAGLPIFQ